MGGGFFMNRQISFLLSFVVGLIFMIIPAMMTPVKHYLFEGFSAVFKLMVWLGFLSVIVFGLVIIFEGIRNILKR